MASRGGRGGQHGHQGGYQGGHQGGQQGHQGGLVRGVDISKVEFYPHTGNAIYDGKRMRKAVKRPTVDYHSPLIRMTETMSSMKDFHDRPFLQPDISYYPEWSPEGRRLITGASSGEFTLWNGFTFNFETILQAHDCAVRCITWNHDKSWMLTGDDSGFIKFWQTNMNNVAMFKAHQEPLRQITDDGTIRIWDFVRTFEERVLRGHGAEVRTAAWHPTKALLASGSRDSQQPMKLWDPKSGKTLCTLLEKEAGMVESAHTNQIWCLDWHPQGHILASGSNDHSNKFWTRTLPSSSGEDQATNYLMSEDGGGGGGGGSYAGHQRGDFSQNQTRSFHHMSYNPSASHAQQSMPPPQQQSSQAAAPPPTPPPPSPAPRPAAAQSYSQTQSPSPASSNAQNPFGSLPPPPLPPPTAPPPSSSSAPHPNQGSFPGSSQAPPGQGQPPFPPHHLFPNPFNSAGGPQFPPGPGQQFPPGPGQQFPPGPGQQFPPGSGQQFPPGPGQQFRGPSQQNSHFPPGGPGPFPPGPSPFGPPGQQGGSFPPPPNFMMPPGSHASPFPQGPPGARLPFPQGTHPPFPPLPPGMPPLQGFPPFNFPPHMPPPMGWNPMNQMRPRHPAPR